MHYIYSRIHLKKKFIANNFISFFTTPLLPWKTLSLSFTCVNPHPEFSSHCWPLHRPCKATVALFEPPTIIGAFIFSQGPLKSRRNSPQRSSIPLGQLYHQPFQSLPQLHPAPNKLSVGHSQLYTAIVSSIVKQISTFLSYFKSRPKGPRSGVFIAFMVVITTIATIISHIWPHFVEKTFERHQRFREQRL